jgi:Arc/MetJ-type ribon-helix-helix transcriptional regulator
VPVPASDQFIAQLAAGVRKTGYSNRSQFIRDAILEKLRRMGVAVSMELGQPPSRAGKSGRKKPARRSPKKPA